MRMLGIDPGTAITGFGVIEAEKNNCRLVTAGVIRTAANSPLPGRLAIISNELAEVMAETRPEIVIVEKLFFAQNVTTAIAVSHARGVILLLAEQAKLPIFEYTPLQVKQALAGYGRADKKQIQEMVRTILKLKEVPKPDDAADALAIAITHAMNNQLL